MVKLITETSYDFNVSEKDSNLYVTGLFSTAELKNQNGRVYPKAILEREIGKLQEKVNNKTCLGELSHPESPETALERAAIMVEALEWKGNEVFGRAKILSTPNGNIAKQLLNDGVKIGISSRGLGSVNESGVVEDSYQLLTYDLVSNPSNHGSWVKGIYEGKEFSENIIKETLSENDIKEAEKEYVRRIWQVLDEIKTKL